MLLSIFGILQLLGAIVGIDILVSEWWIKGLLPRVNGLSYEPSYYATYLLPGWVISLYFLEKQVGTLPKRLVQAAAATTTVALLICTSRLGWGLMLLWVVMRACIRFARFLLGGRTPFRYVRRNMLILSLLPVFVVLVGVMESEHLPALYDSFAFFLGGIGLFGTTSQSADDRTEGFQLTFNAFLAHPGIGTGLGAVPVEIAAQRHSTVESLDDAKQNEGMSVLVELLASIGIVGYTIVAGFVLDLVVKYRIAYRHSRMDLRIFLRGMTWGVAWILLALQFNQNFLRIYLWMDIAVLVCLVSVYLHYDTRNEAERRGMADQY
jgi:hypothetical protein